MGWARVLEYLDEEADENGSAYHRIS